MRALAPTATSSDGAPTGGFVYILASQRNGTLYIGITSDLARRIYEHREDLIDGFTRAYGLKLLVHVERFDEIVTAIAREKAMKKWLRLWKLDLIERGNPDWDDLWERIHEFT